MAIHFKKTSNKLKNWYNKKEKRNHMKSDLKNTLDQLQTKINDIGRSL